MIICATPPILQQNPDAFPENLTLTVEPLVAPPTTAGTTEPSQVPVPGLTTNAIIGIAVGVTLGVLLLIILVPALIIW